jgi:hypothetical protein
MDGDPIGERPREMTDNPYQSSSPADRATLQKLGQRLVDALETYHRLHGVYPPSLEAAGVGPVNTPAGTFEYRVAQEGKRASIYIGDYAERRFRARWSSEIGWFLDE